jgi:hypothetical protein
MRRINISRRTNPPNLTHGGIFTCYDNGMIDTFGNCTCVPNTLNTCPVSTSIPKPPQANTGLRMRWTELWREVGDGVTG